MTTHTSNRHADNILTNIMVRMDLERRQAQLTAAQYDKTEAAIQQKAGTLLNSISKQGEMHGIYVIM